MRRVKLFLLKQQYIASLLYLRETLRTQNIDPIHVKQDEKTNLLTKLPISIIRSHQTIISNCVL